MTGTVRREVVLPVAPEELWPALTEPERLVEWFADSARIDVREGGEAVFGWEGESRRGVVEAVEVARRLCFRWSEAGAGDGGPATPATTRVEFILEPVVEGTRLRVVETGLPGGGDLPGIAATLGSGRGWSRLLHRLRPVATAARAG